MKLAGRMTGYDFACFRRDLTAGVVVGIIAIPLGMGFAIASGVDPRYGLYTTIIAGFLISLLGGSKFQIGGPTGAFVPVLLGIVLQYGYADMLIAGFMAGVMLLLMGLFRVGDWIRYIPRPVVVGFTAGIAVLIFTGQVPNALGLQNIPKHENFLLNLREIAVHIGAAEVGSLVTAIGGLAAMIAVTRFWPRIPSSLVGLAVSALIALSFFHGKLDTIGSVYGGIPNTLPEFVLPALSWDNMTRLAGPAAIIALLGGIESLLSAVVADSMSGDRHRSNRELIGQGVANMAAPLFGGIPATGAIARTAANIRSGAASPVSGIMHSFTVVLVVLLFSPLASAIPLAGMAPVLMIVAWNMSERKSFASLFKTRTGDSLVLAVTFTLTVITNLTTAVAAGMGLAALLFLRQMGRDFTVNKVLPDPATTRRKVAAHAFREERDCPQIAMLTLDGALFFGTAAPFAHIEDLAEVQSPKVLLLRMGNVRFMDASGQEKLAEMLRMVRDSGIIVLFSGVRPSLRELMNRTGLTDDIGADRFFAHTGEAINRALSLLDTKICRGCTHYAFQECSVLSSAQ